MVNTKASSDDLTPLIKEELNVKDVVFESKLDAYMNYSLKPNFKVAGPVLGKNIKAFGAALAQADPAADGCQALEADGKIDTGARRRDPWRSQRIWST